MITQSKNARFGYIRRLMALPLLFILFCAFGVKLNHKILSNPFFHNKPITIVIDAGHGGIYSGAMGNNGVLEKDMDLSIARKIQQLSKDYNVNVIMTRDKDATVGNANSLREDLLNRVKIAESGNAELFISIHVNADGSNEVKNGFEIWLSARDPYYQQSRSLGSVLTEEIKNTYSIAHELRQRQEGTIVLQTPKMPAVLIECGYITNKEDLAFMTNEENQIKIAKDILEGVVKYHNASNNSSPTIKQDTITPFEYSKLKIEGNDLTESYDVEDVGKNEQIMILKFKNGDKLVVKGSPEEFSKYLTNEKENKDTSNPKTYSKVEIEADYPGGQAGWSNYLNKNLKYPQEAINNEIQGTVVAQFIVNTDGTLSDIKIFKSDNKILSKETLRIIEHSGNWIPAMQNGQKVRSYKWQPLVFKLDLQKNP